MKIANSKLSQIIIKKVKVMNIIAFNNYMLHHDSECNMGNILCVSQILQSYCKYFANILWKVTVLEILHVFRNAI